MAMIESIGIPERIQRAVSAGCMDFFAQPIIDVRTGDMASFELLLRVQDENGMPLPTVMVVRSAERLGFILDIDRWVVKRAIELLAQEDLAGRSTRFSINVSGEVFSDLAFLEVLCGELAHSGVSPGRLTIEIAETSAAAEMELAGSFIRTIKECGCRVALDEFGIDGLSLGRLAQLPVDTVKIGGGIIKNLGTDVCGATSIEAIVEAASDRGITTVAEHVEDELLYSLLSEYGVCCAQGYAVGLPAPLDEYLVGPRGSDQPVLYFHDDFTATADVCDPSRSGGVFVGESILE